eukprot:TRINITY_DN2730_c0_g1_i12.p1 TRINITY_DN2730_c0_g1~~TRINITY_DN2730_c0_g1_i12.p1  ORF type:complete len:225 (-),score=30.92 TRINITY_DN2730_c0_g1_i12:254-928(-)
MRAHGSDHNARVAEHTPSCASNGDEFLMHRERNYRACTSTASEPSVSSSVAASIQEGMTTLMLVDLPYALTLPDLRDELELLGFSRSYDFIFYPKERKQNFRGYCFINFVTTAEAQRFAHVFVDHKFELFPSPKLSNVRVSRSQGIQENLAKIKPGAARYNNLFIDQAWLQTARGSYAGGHSGGWHGRRQSAAQWNDYDMPYDSMSYGSHDNMSSQSPSTFAYQ